MRRVARAIARSRRRRAARRAKGWRATAWQSVNAGFHRRVFVDRTADRARGGARIRAKFIVVHRRNGATSVAPEVCASALVGISTGRAIALGARAISVERRQVATRQPRPRHLQQWVTYTRYHPFPCSCPLSPVPCSHRLFLTPPPPPLSSSLRLEAPPRGRTGATSLAREWHYEIP